MGYKASMIIIKFFQGQHRLEEGFAIMQLASNLFVQRKNIQLNKVNKFIFENQSKPT